MHFLHGKKKKTQGHVIGLNCRVTSLDVCSVTRWCNKTFHSEPLSFGLSELEVLGKRSCEEEKRGKSRKCPSSSTTRPAVGALDLRQGGCGGGVDCQGQLVCGPCLFIYFLTKDRWSHLKRAEETHAHTCVKTTHMHRLLSPSSYKHACIHLTSTYSV